MGGWNISRHLPISRSGVKIAKFFRQTWGENIIQSICHGKNKAKFVNQQQEHINFVSRLHEKIAKFVSW